MIITVQNYVAMKRKRKASLDGSAPSSSSSASKQQKTITIEESFANFKKVKQVDVDKSIAEFIAQGIHPLAIIEQPAFVKLVTSKSFIIIVITFLVSCLFIISRLQ